MFKTRDICLIFYVHDCVIWVHTSTKFDGCGLRTVVCRKWYTHEPAYDYMCRIWPKPNQSKTLQHTAHNTELYGT